MSIVSPQGRRDAPGGPSRGCEASSAECIAHERVFVAGVAVFLPDVADVEKYLLQGFSAVLYQKVFIENYF